MTDEYSHYRASLLGAKGQSAGEDEETDFS